MIKIDPLKLSTLLYNITGSYANYTCSCQSQMYSLNSSNSEHAEPNITILYQNKTYTLMQIEYSEGGAKGAVLLEENTIWSYSELLGGIERKSIFTYIGAPGDEKERLYKLVYSVLHPEYNLTLITTLTQLDEETYNTSTTQIIFTRGEKSNATSLELAIIGDNVTLSQLYIIISLIAGELKQIYQNASSELSKAYSIIESELAKISTLVKQHLGKYDRPILYSMVVLVDGKPPGLICWAAGIICMGFIAVVIACALSGVGLIACLAAKLGLSKTAILAAILTAWSLIWACVTLCCCICYDPCCQLLGY
jgi:hypothetical protein